MYPGNQKFWVLCYGRLECAPALLPQARLYPRLQWHKVLLDGLRQSWARYGSALSRTGQVDKQTMTFIQARDTWQFGTEADLEEVIWRNLPELLSLKPVNRQFSIDGKFCDILAIAPSNRLVIIELKNTEDRYIVQQLTRYYHALKTADTLSFSANTDDPRLLAIAPSFHADTLIDC